MNNHPLLVTGATGHIGNVLVRTLLEHGEQIRALILPGEDTTPLSGLDVEQVPGDILDCTALRHALQGVKTVFHLAGVISILPGEQPRVRQINVQGTLNVLKTAMQTGVERLIYTSSIHALARLPHGQTVDEQTPFDPHNPYGVYDQSKAQATLAVQQAAAEGLPAVIACPTGVIGPFDFRGSFMGSLIRSAATQQMTPYVDGAYDFVDVRDVAAGLLAAWKKGRPGETYILSGEQITIKALLETVRQITGKNFLQVRVPLALARLVARFTPLYYRLTQRTPRFTPYALEVLQSNCQISHAKASRELGYQPRPLYESIRDTVHWFLAQRYMPA
ncbi:MAG: epimerase [Anaerolineae bacterium]|nr:MAG: epimerase [Anaerolineae bacterium]